MAPSFTFKDLASDLGTTTADGMRNVANTAANFACGLYQDYAQFTTGFGDPTGIGAFNNALYSELCSPRGKQPTAPPSTPFSGGQCTGKNYNVSVTYTRPDNTTGSVFFASVPGPLSGTGVLTYPSGTSKALGVLAPNATAYNGILPVASTSADGSLDGYKIVSVTPTPLSGTDNCGDPPPQYPTNVPPPSRTNTNTTVNVGAGVAVAVPIIYTPISFKANATINPQFNIRVGPFDVTFDAGGVTIAPSFTFGSDKTIPTPGQQPNNTTPTVPQKPGSNGSSFDPSSILAAIADLKTRVDAIKTELDDVKDCSCPRSYSVSTASLGSGNGGYAALPANTIKVSLSLTAKPKNAKVQQGGGSEPALYFCGYFYWGDGTGRGNRVAISAQQSVFFPPTWATAFGWSLYPGYLANVTATSLVPSKTDSELAVVQMKKKP